MVAVGVGVTVLVAVTEQPVVGTVGIVRIVVAFVVDFVARVVRASDAVVAVRYRARLYDTVENTIADFDAVAPLAVVAVGVVFVVLAPIERLVAPIVGARDVIIAIRDRTRLSDAVKNIVADLDAVTPLGIVAVRVVFVMNADIVRFVAPIIRARDAVAALEWVPTRAIAIQAGLVFVALQLVIAVPAVRFVVIVAIA